MKKYMRQWLLILTLTLTCAGLSGCASSKEKKNELDGTITGNTYQAAFYSTTEISLWRDGRRST